MHACVRKQFVATMSVLIGVMITIIIVLPWFAVAILPVGLCYYKVQVQQYEWTEYHDVVLPCFVSSHRVFAFMRQLEHVRNELVVLGARFFFVQEPTPRGGFVWGGQGGVGGSWGPPRSGVGIKVKDVHA